MGDISARLTVVLHQIRSPDNLGAVARLMANFGLEKLALSDPATYGFTAAKKLAVGAEPLLDHLRLYRSLPDAVGHAIFAVGTTSRRLRNREVLDPEDGVRRLAKNARQGEVALVFGGEKRGLSDEELAWCQEVIRIPTLGTQQSMNVAQAAAVLLYLCHRERRSAPLAAKPEARAPLSLVNQLENLMEPVLAHAGFLNLQSPERALRVLFRPLLRGEITRREVEMWLAAFRQLRRALNLRSPVDR
jgi:tRNA/rRNA methyltransferase